MIKVMTMKNDKNDKKSRDECGMTGIISKVQKPFVSTTLLSAVLSSVLMMMPACTQSMPVLQSQVGKRVQAIKTIKVVQKDQNITPNQLYVDHNHNHNHDHNHDIPRNVGTKADFDAWLALHPHVAPQVAEYEQYLTSRLGLGQLPPMYELLTTARSWQECGHEPYEVPPRALWDAMIPTIILFNDLRLNGILPDNTHIRSVYRSPDLNRCAGGAVSSKHMTNGAMDIWVPNIDMGSHEMFQLQNRLCEYWLFNGKLYEFGLGLYATGAIHLDTQGYRKWGAQFSENHSICRITPSKSDE